MEMTLDDLSQLISEYKGTSTAELFQKMDADAGGIVSLEEFLGLTLTITEAVPPRIRGTKILLIMRIVPIMPVATHIITSPAMALAFTRRLMQMGAPQPRRAQAR